jgi:Na+/melibiose symporter-like transporter
MLVFDPEQVALKRKQSHLAKGAGLGFGLVLLLTQFAMAFYKAPAAQFWLLVAVFFCLIAIAATFWFSFATDRRYGALTDKVTVAQLILVRRDYPAVDRALYTIERQGRDVCRGEARVLLSQT